MVTVRLQLSAEQLKALDELIPKVHGSRSQLVRRALDLYLYRLECERDARIYEAMPLTDEELALADDPERWSAIPKW